MYWLKNSDKFFKPVLLQEGKVRKIIPCHDVLSLSSILKRLGRGPGSRSWSEWCAWRSVSRAVLSSHVWLSGCRCRMHLEYCNKVVRCGVCCRSTRVRPWASVTLSTPVSVSSCPTPVTLSSRWRPCPPSWLANWPPPSPSFTPSTSVRGLGYTARSPKTFC